MNNFNVYSRTIKLCQLTMTCISLFEDSVNFYMYLFRYQIIGYQIISGHIVHNTEHDNREREQDSQSGVDGEETSEQSGAEDTTREMSGTIPLGPIYT